MTASILLVGHLAEGVNMLETTCVGNEMRSGNTSVIDTVCSTPIQGYQTSGYIIGLFISVLIGVLIVIWFAKLYKKAKWRE